MDFSVDQRRTTPSSDEYYIELLNLLLENKLADAVGVEWTIPERQRQPVVFVKQGITTFVLIILITLRAVKRSCNK